MSEITRVYDGRALISFHGAKHYYTVSIPSQKVSRLYQPGVTTIIGKLDKSEALVKWATKQMAERIMQLLESSGTDVFDRDTVLALVDLARDTYEDTKERAATIGSHVHRILEAKLTGKEVTLPIVADSILAPDLTPEMLQNVNLRAEAALQFLAEHKFKVIEVEQPRWSPRWGYIGTGDLVAEFDGVLSFLDWKNQKKLYPKVRLQLAAYQNAYQEEHPEQFIGQRVAVNIDPDGVVTHEIYTHGYAADLDAFLSLLNVWRWDRPNEWPAGTKSAPALLTEAQIGAVLYGTNVQ